MEALEEMHAAECETLRAEIDRLQCYAARLVVHNDHLLKGAKGNQESLPEVPPPWWHPKPAPPAEETTTSERLGLQAKVIAHKLADLERQAADAAVLLREIRGRAGAERDARLHPKVTLERLAHGVEPEARVDARALVQLARRGKEHAERARRRAGEGAEDDPRGGANEGGGGGGDDDGLSGDAFGRFAAELSALLRVSAGAGARAAQLVQVGAIIEVASTALRAATDAAEREREAIRDARLALDKKLDALARDAEGVPVDPEPEEARDEKRRRRA